MTFAITGLAREEFAALFTLSDDALAARGVIRKKADKSPGYPCRITLEDARPGETVLLLNYESHKANTPYRSAYAIFVREGAERAAHFIDELPPVLCARPIALRVFDRQGMLIGADLGRSGDETKAKIIAAFADPHAAYIHAHNAMHGCFAAAIVRA
ncbi:MAG: DUF1203 domain-containing protein [Parvularculaceae bacterium]|nr:DUF1203 domain-containing protein [Parvularculaceae bacterium]